MQLSRSRGPNSQSHKSLELPSLTSKYTHGIPSPKFTREVLEAASVQKSYQFGPGGLMTLGGLETITEKNKLSRQQQIDNASMHSLIDL